MYHMVYLFWVRYSWWIILWGQRPKTKKEVKLQLWLSCEKAQGGEVRGIFTESSVCDVTFPFLKIVFACLHTDSSLTTETSKTGTSLHFFTPKHLEIERSAQPWTPPQSPLVSAPWTQYQESILSTSRSPSLENEADILPEQSIPR